MVAVLIPASIYGYFESIDWCPVHRPVSLHSGRIEQTFKVNYTARYFADFEFQTGTLSPDTVQCLTGVTDFSPKPKCNESEKPILSFSWRLLRGGKEVSSGRYGEDRGGGISASTVEADFADFEAKRGDRYTLVVDVDSDATRLDVASPTLYVTVNPVNLESAMVLEGFSRIAAVALWLVGLACFLLGIRWQRRMSSVLLIVVAASGVGCLDGCSRKPSDPRAALVGQYRLYWGNGSNCSGRGIESSTLELRADGTSEQRDRFKDGSQFVTAGRWEYDGNDGVLFDKLRTTTTLEIDKNAAAMGAGLIVQWSKPPNILLNPHDDCLFAKTQ